MHIKDPLPLIKKSSPCSGGSGFPLSLSFYIWPTSNKRNLNVLSTTLKKYVLVFFSIFESIMLLS